MAQFHETMMGKRFIESTVPQLVRAVQKLNANLEPQVEYDTMIALLYVNEGDRAELENITNLKFNSIDELAEVNDGICVCTLSDFAEMLNNNDDDCDDIHIKDRWVGYIQLRKGAIAEHQHQQQQQQGVL